jgi:hypothetical protein
MIRELIWVQYSCNAKQSKWLQLGTRSVKLITAGHLVTNIYLQLYEPAEWLMAGSVMNFRQEEQDRKREVAW